MISCRECIDRFKLLGDDPRVKSGRYNLCACDYCDKPCKLEQPKQETNPRHGEIEQCHGEIEQLKAWCIYLQNKLNTKKKDII
jgi:hypothetical protein